MEQLAPVIAWIKKNQFWLLCGLLAIMMGAIYFLSVSGKNKETKERTAAIEGLQRDIRMINAVNAEGVDDNSAAHPNKNSEKGMSARIKLGEESAIKAWILRRQQQKDLLVFPEKEINNKEFIDAVKDFFPAEEGKDVKIDDFGDLRGIYKDKLNSIVSNLLPIVGTSWKHDKNRDPEAKKSGGTTTKKRAKGTGGLAAPTSGGGSGGAGASVGGDYANTAPTGTGKTGGDKTQRDLGLRDDIVVWNEKNQDLWFQKITEFRGNDSTDNNPTTYEILLLQEDLWVFEAILKIIAKVNTGADANDLADVKQIDHILVGREAWLSSKKTLLTAPNVEVTDSTLAQDLKNKKRDANAISGKLGEGKEKKKKNKLGKAGRPTDTIEFNFGAVDDPSHGRYIDQNGQPIHANDVFIGVMADKLTNYASLTVAKNIPVRVAVVMNEKQIGEFLSACAESPLAFEVRQVRINRHTAGDGEFIIGETSSSGSGGKGASSSSTNLEAPTSGGGAGSAGAAVGGEFDREGGDSKAGGSSGGGRVVVGSVESRTNYNVKVEFYGIIKIYNPVRYKLLGKQDAAKPADAGKTDKTKKKDKKSNKTSVRP